MQSILSSATFWKHALIYFRRQGLCYVLDQLIFSKVFLPLFEENPDAVSPWKTEKPIYIIYLYLYIYEEECV